MIELNDPDPELVEVIAAIESNIMAAISLLYPGHNNIQWMLESFAIGVEAVGYNQLGKKFRIIETLFPHSQSISATDGVLDVTRDAFMADIGEASFDPEDE